MRLWNEFLKRKEQSIGATTVHKWLTSLKIINYDAANLYLEAQDTFQAQWFEEYLRPTLKSEFVNENNRPIKVHIQIKHKKEPSEKSLSKVLSPDQYHPVIDSIDPGYTLESFVRSDQNRILLKLIESFQSLDGKKSPLYNPIYIYGSEGLGKTHLLQAAFQLLEAQNKKVRYTKLLTFMDNMVKAMKESKMSEFRKFYRNVDILIVDDIHQLSHKNATQEEFFHTFNALHIEGKQILLSSVCSPQQLVAIEPRLMSRFEWGIVLPLNNPTKQDLSNILQEKLKQLQFPLSSPVKEYLIKKFKSPLLLQKALSALILRAHLRLPQGKKLKSINLTIPSIELLLTDLIQLEESEKVTPERIVEKIAHYFGIRNQDILGKSQSRECAWPRQICMFFFREILQMPYMQIGRYFERDHSTVMSGIKQVHKNLKNPDNESFKLISGLRESIAPSYLSSKKPTSLLKKLTNQG